MADEFLATFEPRYREAAKDVTPTEELFYVVDVGQPSETETRAVYRDADNSVSVLTKSFEYFDAVETALADALDQGVDIDVLFLHPDHLSPENRAVQERIVDRIRSSYPVVGIRFSEEQLPWRGTLADPSMERDGDGDPPRRRERYPAPHAPGRRHRERLVRRRTAAVLRPHLGVREHRTA